jgi:hypothetical protein
MRRCDAALLLASATALAGCGALQPFATAPATARPGQPEGARVAICYNAVVTPLAAVAAEAQQECGPAMAAVPVETDWYLQHCPVLLPARASFRCAPR